MGIAAFGSKLKIGDGSDPENFTTVSEVKSLGGPGLSADTEDITNHDSAGAFEEAVVTILRSGEVTFTMNYLPTDGTHDGSTGLLNDYKNRELRNFQLVFPNAANTQWEFSAFVTGFEPTEDVDGVLETDVTLKVSGQPVLN